MKLIVLLLGFFISPLLQADSCQFLYLKDASSRMKLRLSHADALKGDDVKALTRTVRSHLKLNKVSFANLNTEEGRYIQILEGDGSSPIERMAKFLDKNYETKLVVDPTLTSDSDFLGYFTYIDNEPAIALRPEDLINLGRDDYSTLMHEARHARYDYLKRTNRESMFHSEFLARKENKFTLPGEKTQAYTDYMNFEEIPLHANDFQRELYFYTRLDPIQKAERLPRLKSDFERVRALSERSRVWLKKVRQKVEGSQWQKYLRGGLDDYEFYLSVKMGDVDFRATFVKNDTLKKISKLSDEKIPQIGRNLLKQRLDKLQSFLDEMHLSTNKMEKIFKNYSNRHLSHEEFSKELSAEYNNLKKIINRESALK